jgi:HD-GYP domain-containing protein (c-di-GMP phosphodiesterase class II)
LESRIIGVADVVEAMTYHRPYREALGLDAALAEIQKNRDILFDAEVVDDCTKVFREEKLELSVD